MVRWYGKAVVNNLNMKFDDGISLDRLNELTIEEGPVAPTATPTISDSRNRKKPNRQKQRKERKEAQIQKLRDEAEKEAEGQVDRGQLESDAIKELLVPMQLRVSAVCCINPLFILLNIIYLTTYLTIDKKVPADGHWYVIMMRIP
jgi:hypothetical protein